jgi:pyruvate dehydrogenase E2 component (dihydrolipoamide acetyltransferase)
MPQLSDTMTEGTVVQWHKKEGDAIKSGEEIAEIETDKATMPMEAFDDGVMAAILVPQGQKAPVGTLLAVIATGGENPAEVRKKIGSSSQPAPAPSGARTPRERVAASRRPAVAAASGATFAQASSGEIREADEVGHGATRQAAVSVPPVSHQQGNGKERLRVSPLARRVAAEKNIDLHALRGSGPGGRIVKEDVLTFKPGGASSAQPQGVERGKTQVIALTKMRAAIARSLVGSKQNIPHFYETIDVDVEELSQLRVKLNELLEAENIRLGVGDFISKAVAAALLRHPAVNATFDGTQITRHGDVHLGIAVAIPDGLIVPVLRNIESMGLKEIRQRSADLIERARAQRLKQEEMTGGTFTVSNLGPFGIREFSAIINPPQVAILAIAAAEKRAVVRKDQIVPRTTMSLTLSADHRVVDGAVAADFLRTLKSLLEQPGAMLL